MVGEGVLVGKAVSVEVGSAIGVGIIAAVACPREDIAIYMAMPITISRIERKR